MYYDKNNPESVEKYSSAVSLSDMEIFIFPEIMYALVLANIVSPSIWNWKKDPWFDSMGKLNEYRKLQRAKQYIMDQFVFNLDLDTWGMTTKPVELKRFERFIDPEVLKNSNALFGYEGDKYYFDIDIRRHFGLDNYTSDVIPYWKTETIEAMEAFKHREGYECGAGECVSFSTLYAAALFVLAEIPLERIHLFATPLHSQNFIDIRDGIVTNNRRLVTKNMWFNGTELSAKARRALENEKVTMVVNNRGYIHTMYDEATLDPESYAAVTEKLKGYLTTEITFEVMASFLRENSKLQGCFQLSINRNGKVWYIGAETVYGYEHSSKSRVGTDSHKALLSEIDIDEFFPHPFEHRIDMDELEQFLSKTKVKHHDIQSITELKSRLSHCCLDGEEVIGKLMDFCSIDPLLPDPREKTFIEVQPIELNASMSREEMIEYLKTIRHLNPAVDLAFMALRDMNEAPWLPFLKAAFERNPVVATALEGRSIDEIYSILQGFENESIYPESRFAQPDEVWNYRRGEGLERAIAFASSVKRIFPETALSFAFEAMNVAVTCGENVYTFQRTKEVILPTTEDFAPFI